MRVLFGRDPVAMLAVGSAGLWGRAIVRRTHEERVLYWKSPRGDDGGTWAILAAKEGELVEDFAKRAEGMFLS